MKRSMRREEVRLARVEGGMREKQHSLTFTTRRMERRHDPEAEEKEKNKKKEEERDKKKNKSEKRRRIKTRINILFSSLMAASKLQS